MPSGPAEASDSVRATGIALGAVSDAVLLESAEALQVVTLPRSTGAPAARGRALGAVRRARQSGDPASGRATAIDLARELYERTLDLPQAVTLLHRSLESRDDRELRAELGRWLAEMARHVEAGHVLRGGQPRDQRDLEDSLLRAGEAYARGGEATLAATTYDEAMLLAPDDPRPAERLGALATWAPEAVAARRGAEAWLEAARRHGAGSAGASIAVCRAFELAPHLSAAMEAYVSLLGRQARSGAADEVMREHGAATRQVVRLARRRLELALDAGEAAIAIGAAFDAATAPGDGRDDDDDEGGDELLRSICEREALTTLLGATGVTDALLSTAHTAEGAPRGDALLTTAKRLEGEPRALLCALAAESYAARGEAPRALKAARQAVAIAPWMARAQSALVIASAGAGEQVRTGELEAALGCLPARARHYRRLADLHATRGELGLATAWSRRVVELRPGDAAAQQQLLERASTSGQAELLERALREVLAAARPLGPLASSFATGLRVLGILARPRAAAVSRTTLGTVGSPDAALWPVVDELLSEVTAPHRRLQRLVFRAAGDRPGDERARLLLEASELARSIGNIEAACEHLCSAAAGAAPVERLRELTDALEPEIVSVPLERRSDAVLALAHARAWTAEQESARQAIQAWRALAALRWDLAGDEVGADEAYFIACAQDPERGPYRYAVDLCDRAGPHAGIERVLARAASLGDDADPRLRGRLLAAAARVALTHGFERHALEAAVGAVHSDPSRSDAVAVVEKLAEGEQGVAALNGVYEVLAKASLGRFGRRAARYRAARQLERLGAHDDALRHAVAAFELAPSTGASYRLLLRVAERAGDDGAAIQAMASAAAGMPLAGRVAWLERAADLARRREGCHEVAFDLLLQAFKLAPRPETAARLCQAAEKLVDGSGDEIARIRLEHAIEAVLPDLESIEGARTAIELGVLAARALGDARLCALSVERALALDCRAADYGPLVPLLDIFSAERPVGVRLLREINELRAQVGVDLAPGLRDLTARLYLKLSDVPPPPSLSPTGSQPPPSTKSWPPIGPLARSRPPSDSDQPGDSTPPDPRPPGDRTITARPMPLAPAAAHADPTSTDRSEPLASADAGAGAEDAAAEAREIELPLATDDEHGADAGAAGAPATVPPAGAETGPTEVPAPPETSAPPPVASEHLARADAAAPEPPAADSEGAPTTPRAPASLDFDSIDESLESVDFSAEAERRARERGDYEGIARMLAARAAATENLEQRRLVRLRRAAVLEQRMEDLEGACRELERVLDETGEEPTALRYLADLRDRQRHHGRAAKLWLRAAKGAADAAERLRDVVRCCESLLLTNRAETARRLVESARESLGPSPQLARLRAEIARRMNDEDGLADALDELDLLRRKPAHPSAPPGRAGSSPPARAGVRAQSAPPPHPGAPAPPEQGAADALFAADELEALRLDYCQRGPASLARARQCVRKLRAIRPALGDVLLLDLHTFLLAEAVESADGEDASLRELQAHWEEHGRSPLVSIALAERQARRGEGRAALALYQRVLADDATELHGVRSRGQLALEAAELAHELGDDGAARRWLALAAESDDARVAAERREVDWFGQGRAEVALEPAGGDGRGGDGESLRRLAWSSRPPPPPAELAMPPRPRTPAPEPESTPAPDREERAPDSLRNLGWGSEQPPQSLAWSSRPPEEEGPETEEQPASEPPAPERTAPGPDALHRLDLEADGPLSMVPPASRAASSPAPRGSLPVASQAEERALLADLLAGSFEAGEALVARFARSAEPRTADTLRVRRWQALLRKGDPMALAQLRQAARADQNEPYARAVEHVIAAFDPELAAVVPPRLEHLPAQPEAARRLLFAPLGGGLPEALAIVWDTGLLRRDMAEYGLTGADRVAPGGSPIGRVCAEIGRLLDLGGRLYHRDRGLGPLRGAVALLMPLGAVLRGAGELAEHDLEFVVASTMAAATPSIAPLEALATEVLEDLAGAMTTAFGPVGSTANATGVQRRLAEDLWHVVPTAAARRLHELCAVPEQLHVPAAQALARQVRRRAGLFACGDLAVAVGHVLAEIGLSSRAVRGPGALVDLCLRSEEIADLFDLSIQPEFAEARWRRAAAATVPPSRR
jgi:tetratricopeptide (TPR) repeat protein